MALSDVLSGSAPPAPQGKATVDQLVQQALQSVGSKASRTPVLREVGKVVTHPAFDAALAALALLSPIPGDETAILAAQAAKQGVRAAPRAIGRLVAGEEAGAFGVPSRVRALSNISQPAAARTVPSFRTFAGTADDLASQVVQAVPGRAAQAVRSGPPAFFPPAGIPAGAEAAAPALAAQATEAAATAAPGLAARAAGIGKRALKIGIPGMVGLGVGTMLGQGAQPVAEPEPESAQDVAQPPQPEDRLMEAVATGVENLLGQISQPASPGPQEMLAYQAIASQYMQPYIDQIRGAGRRQAAALQGMLGQIPAELRGVESSAIAEQSALTDQLAASYGAAAQVMPYLAQVREMQTQQEQQQQATRAAMELAIQAMQLRALQAQSGAGEGLGDRTFELLAQQQG